MTANNKFTTPLILFLFILVSRAFVYFVLEIQPEIQYLFVHYQHLNIVDLNENLLSSILKLHSQSPIWNVILGIASKTCNADPSCVLVLIHLSNIVLTFLVCLMLYAFLRLYGLPHGVTFVAACVYALLPSTVYYENYIFYPHFIAFLVAAFLYFALLYFRRGRTGDMVLSFSAIVLLSWTWGLFHPVIMTAIIFLVFLLGKRRDGRRALTALAFAALLFLPSTKNLIVFGFFGNSSWLGLNISQVAPEVSDECSFRAFRRTVGHISHSGTAFNDPSIISYASHCKREALASISDNFDQYLYGRAIQILRSTGRMPSDDIFPPNGFEKYPRIDLKRRVLLEDGSLHTIRAMIVSCAFIFNAVLIFTVLLSPVLTRSERPEFRRVFLLGAILLILVVVIGHAANGFEQERMRYALNSVLYFTFVVIAWHMAMRALRRFQSE